MNDLELIKKCAERTGIGIVNGQSMFWLSGEGIYDPLHNDAQAMALVKKLGISLFFEGIGEKWEAEIEDETYYAFSIDLNRAICECVAKLDD